MDVQRGFNPNINHQRRDKGLERKSRCTLSCRWVELTWISVGLCLYSLTKHLRSHHERFKNLDKRGVWKMFFFFFIFFSFYSCLLFYSKWSILEEKEVGKKEIVWKFLKEIVDPTSIWERKQRCGRYCCRHVEFLFVY